MQEPKKFSENLTFSWVSQKANNPNKWQDFHNLDELEKRERILSLIFHLQLDVTDVRRICCLGLNETGLMNYLTNGLLDQFTTPSATQTAATKLEVMFVNLSLDPSYVAKNWNGLHYLRNKFRRDGTPSNGRCPFDQNQTICGCWGTPTRMKNAFINTAHVDRILKWQKSNVFLAVSWDLTDYDGENEDDEEIAPPAQNAPPVDIAQADVPLEDKNPLYAELIEVFLEATELCSRIISTAADVSSSSSGVSVITISDEDNEFEESVSITTDDSVVILADDIEIMNHQVDTDILHSGSSKQVESVVEVQMDQDTVVDNQEFETGSGLNDGTPNSGNQTLECSRTEELVNSEINGKKSILKGSSSLREQTGSQQASELLIPDKVRPLGPIGQDYEEIVVADGGELPNSEMVFENLGHRHVPSDASARATVKASDQEYNSTFNGHLVAEHHETEEVPGRNNVIKRLEPDHETAPVKDSRDGERILIILNNGNGGSEDNLREETIGKLPFCVAEQLLNGSHCTEKKEESLGGFIAEGRSPRGENASVRENSSYLPDHSREIQNKHRNQDNSKVNQKTLPGRDNEKRSSTGNSNTLKNQKLRVPIEGQPSFGNRSTEEKAQRLERLIGKLKRQGEKMNAVESGNSSLNDSNSKVYNRVQNKSSLECGQGTVERRDNGCGSKGIINTSRMESYDRSESHNDFKHAGRAKRPNAGRVKITMTEDEVNSNIMQILESAEPHLLNPTSSFCVDSESTNVLLSANGKPRADRGNQRSRGKCLNEPANLLPSFARENKGVSSQLTVEDLIRNCLSLPVLESNRKSRKTSRKITRIGGDVGCLTKGEPSKKSFSERFSRLIKLVTPPKQLTKRKRARSSRKRLMELDESEAPAPKIAIQNCFAESSFDLINKMALESIIEVSKPGAEQDVYVPDLTGIDQVLQAFLVKMDQEGIQ